MPFLAVLAAACGLAAAPAAAQVILLGPNEAEHFILRREPVRLPPEVEELGIRGEVRVIVEVGPDGRLRRVQLVSGHPLLVEPALRALRRYRFRPVEIHGRPVAWRGQVRIPVPDPVPRQDPREARAGPGVRPGPAAD